MFDKKSADYQKVKKHFGPYQSHPVVDTIQKYINGLKRIDEQNMAMFVRESYGYYFALKMNACSYSFDKRRKIKNNGTVKDIAKDWYMFDPMRETVLMEDFVRETGFTEFYRDNTS